MTEVAEKLILIEKLIDKVLILNDDPFLKQVKEKCTSCHDACKNSTQGDADDMKNLLKQYAQIVLDYTYSDEGKLVDESFPEDSYRQRIHEIFVWIDTIEELVLKCLPQITMTECLGHEIVECIHWRKGALLYMLCCTIKEDDRRVDNLNDEFFMNIKDGVGHLQKMLRVKREITEWNGDQHAVDLVNMGVYSDTHPLCMMYAGEMCYWYCQFNRKSMPDFNAKEIGQDLLSKYIKIVKSPLMFGWTSDKAEEFLTFLSQCP